MAITIPVNRAVMITARQNYVMQIGLCNSNATSSFSVSAFPVFVSSYLEHRGFKTPTDTATSSFTFTPGDDLRHVVSQRTDGTASSTLYNVYDYAPRPTLSATKNGTAVTVTLPFGANYTTVSNVVEAALETNPGNSPKKYYYSVTYGSATGGVGIVSGYIDVNIKSTATTAATPTTVPFSVCSIGVN